MEASDNALSWTSADQVFPISVRLVSTEDLGNIETSCGSRGKRPTMCGHCGCKGLLPQDEDSKVDALHRTRAQCRRHNRGRRLAREKVLPMGSPACRREAVLRWWIGRGLPMLGNAAPAWRLDKSTLCARFLYVDNLDIIGSRQEDVVETQTEWRDEFEKRARRCSEWGSFY